MLFIRATPKLCLLLLCRAAPCPVYLICCAAARMSEQCRKHADRALKCGHAQVLCTTVGESFSDLINVTVGLGLGKTTAIFASVLLVFIIAQFALKRYDVFVYWPCVVLISVVGTLITDALTDVAGLELWISTLVFGLVLLSVFVAWWLLERTLSVHTIFTTRREALYWLAILFTFAMGTATGAHATPVVLMCLACLASNVCALACTHARSDASARERTAACRTSHCRTHMQVCR